MKKLLLITIPFIFGILVGRITKTNEIIESLDKARIECAGGKLTKADS